MMFPRFISKSIALLFSAMILFNGCKKDSSPSEPEKTPDPEKTAIMKPDSLVHFETFDMHVFMNDKGVLSNEIPTSGTYPFFRTSNGLAGISCAGLWLGANSLSPSVSMVFHATLERSNFSSRWDTLKGGIFRVTADMTKLPPPRHIKELGFPVDKDGNVKLYGSEMYWQALRSFKNEAHPPYTNPVPDIKVTQAVFAHWRKDLENVLFIRYDITNMGNSDLNDMYAGYWSDTDITFGPLGNSTGYDYPSAFTYTYSKDRLYSRDSSLIVGFSFLASPFDNSSYPHGVTSHRIIRKNFHRDFGETMESRVIGPKEVYFALQGLTNHGEEMTDPLTNQPSKFAFTGDPYAGSGWIDSWTGDTRNLIGSGPFSLKSKETKTLVVAWLCKGGDTFPNCISDIKTKLEKIRNEKSLWQ